MPFARKVAGLLSVVSRQLSVGAHRRKASAKDRKPRKTNEQNFCFDCRGIWDWHPFEHYRNEYL
jgi:hypothetical protein